MRAIGAWRILVGGLLGLCELGWTSMSKLFFNYYWLAFATTRLLFLLLLPVIFVAQEIFVPYLVVATLLGWSAIIIAMIYKCPQCNGRALVQSGVVVRKIESNRSRLSSWLVSNELAYQYFYCCKCGHKIKANKC